MKYVIISIESRNLNPEGEVLYIKANPVKDAGPSFRHLEKMFGKKYYHYSHTESDETTHFVLPFSESTLNRFLTIANRAETAEEYESFWSPNLSDYYESSIRIQETGEIINVYKHRDLSKPIYYFIPVFDLAHARVNGEKIFMVSTNRRKLNGPFSDKPEDYIIHYFVFAYSEEDSYISETEEAMKNNKPWTPDLSNFIKEEITLVGVNRFTGEQTEEKHDLYISRKLSYQNIMDNLNQLLPLF